MIWQTAWHRHDFIETEVNGSPGLILRDGRGTHAVLTLAATPDGLISAIYVVRNPDKLISDRQETSSTVKLIWLRYNGARSRGGVKVPTGGIGRNKARARERSPSIGEVSRFGEIPKPTVIVRMEESECSYAARWNARGHGCIHRPDSGL